MPASSPDAMPGDVGPHHRPAQRAKAGGQQVDVLELARVGLVGGGKQIGAGIGFLRVYIDQHRLVAKAKTLAGGLFLTSWYISRAVLVLVSMSCLRSVVDEHARGLVEG